MQMNLKMCLLFVSFTINILMHAVIIDSQETESQNKSLYQQIRDSVSHTCNLEIDTGFCPKTSSRRPKDKKYWYNKDTGRCVLFQHHNCGKNANNFESETECQDFCFSFRKKTNVTTDLQKAKRPLTNREICNLPPDNGNSCEYGQVNSKYWYNKKSNKCEILFYFGCKGNANNFKTKKNCKAKCSGRGKKIKVTAKTQPQNSTSLIPDNPQSSTTPLHEPENSQNSTFPSHEPENPQSSTSPTHDSENSQSSTSPSHEPENSQGSTSPSYDPEDPRSSTFPTPDPENPQSSTSSTHNPEICNLQLDNGYDRPCSDMNHYSPRLKYWYNRNTNKCETFTYYNCGGNANNFKSRIDCETACSSFGIKINVTTDLQEAKSQSSTFPTHDPENSQSSTSPTHDPENSQSSTSPTHNLKQLCNLDPDVIHCYYCNYTTCIPLFSFPFKRYYYNKYTDECDTFPERFCGGNTNSFMFKTDCEAICLGLGKTNVTVKFQKSKTQNSTSVIPHSILYMQRVPVLEKKQP